MTSARPRSIPPVSRTVVKPPASVCAQFTDMSAAISATETS